MVRKDSEAVSGDRGKEGLHPLWLSAMGDGGDRSFRDLAPGRRSVEGADYRWAGTQRLSLGLVVLTLAGLMQQASVPRSAGATQYTAVGCRGKTRAFEAS